MSKTNKERFEAIEQIFEEYHVPKKVASQFIHHLKKFVGDDSSQRYIDGNKETIEAEAAQQAIDNVGLFLEYPGPDTLALLLDGPRTDVEVEFFGQLRTGLFNILHHGKHQNLDGLQLLYRAADEVEDFTQVGSRGMTAGQLGTWLKDYVQEHTHASVGTTLEEPRTGHGHHVTRHLAEGLKGTRNRILDAIDGLNQSDEQARSLRPVRDLER